MLPVIDLHLADYCHIAFNYCLGLYMPVGHSLWFDWGETVKSAKGLQLNLDEHLTALLASLFAKEAAEALVLTLYAAIPGRLALCLCSPEPVDFFHTGDLSSTLPACVDRRRDFIPQTAAPFLLYETGSVRRLHPLTEPDRTAFHVWDFSDCRGNFLKEVDKAFYFRVMNDKNTYCDYGVVPKNSCTSITYHDTVITVDHVFCELM
jgi:hypothetical protein